MLVPLPFGVWGGMWKSIVSAPDHCLFLSIFHSQPKIRAVAGFWTVVRAWDAESVLRVPKARDGKSKRGRCPPLVRWVRENARFRNAADAFLLPLECNFGLSVHFVGMLEEIFLILVMFGHLTQTYWKYNYFDTSPNHDGTWKSRVFKGHASIFSVGKSIEYESLIKIRTVQLSVFEATIHTWQYVFCLIVM